ncbi:acyltransferase domain-containing protein [Dactylosporangium sp. CA-092794]|uniref:acyltransferase domain-containing protein n=1 Tax=Dactylosporangium sp. CA-092794 TaxID=3239929 RepID=UPI003D8FBF2C
MGPAPPAAVPAGPRPVALLFAGQGAQHPRMGAGLYDAEPGFAAAMDTVLGHLDGAGRRLRRAWLDTGTAVDGTLEAQSLLFALGYAIGRMVTDWGVRPAVLLGHSVGELAAAALAGVFDVGDAIRLVAHRSRCAERAGLGGMLAVAAGAAEITPLLPEGTAIAAVNAPRNTVVAGPAAALPAVGRRLRDAGLAYLPVRSGTAFHSPMMAPVVAATLPMLARTRLRPPRIPLVSGCTAAELLPDQATDPAFWAAQPMACVRFWPALDTLLARGRLMLLDTAPRAALATIARRHPAVACRASEVVAVLPGRPGDDARAARAAAQRLRQEGHRIAEHR